MKKILAFIGLVALIICNVNAQATPQELMNRVNSQGVRPSQDRYNMYVDKMNNFFKANEWADAVVNIKEIIQRPEYDPNDWYYFVSVKTQKCTQPFYISYDIGDSNIGVVFQIETSFLPTEIKAHIDKQVGSVMAQREVEDAKRKEIEEKEYREWLWGKIYHNTQNAIKDTLEYELNARLDTIILPDYADDIKLLVLSKYGPNAQKIMGDVINNELSSSKEFVEMLVYLQDEKRFRLKYDEMYDESKNYLEARFAKYVKDDIYQTFDNYFGKYFPGLLDSMAHKLQELPQLEQSQIDFYR